MMYNMLYNMIYNRITHLNLSFSVPQQASALALLKKNYGMLYCNVI